jgi:hypothetical protein
MNGLNSSQVNGMPAKVPRQAVGHNDKKSFFMDWINFTRSTGNDD